jgi:CheY-like chemotaxis protein
VWVKQWVRQESIMSAAILIVDDDDTLGRVLGRVLTRLGQSVVRATHVAQALQLAREHQPRLALIDLCLPDGDGAELARLLRSESAEMTLILMTAFPLRLREEPELAGRFADVLIKPLDLADLRRVVEAALPPALAAVPGR